MAGVAARPGISAPRVPQNIARLAGGRARTRRPGGPSGHGPQINPIPGMTDTGLLPKAAEAAGLCFDQVVERILAEAALGA